MALHCGRASVVGAVLLGAVLAGWGQAPAANPAVPAPPGPSQPGAGQPVPADAYPQLRRHEDDPGFTLNVNAREVILDVIVTNARGQVVKRLQPGDLTLYEDGVPQKIVSFQQHEGLSAATAASLAGPKLPPNVFSNYIGAGNTNALTVILIDTQDTGIVDQAVVRANLISYMKSVPAGHPIAVFQFDTSMHLVQGFSSDPKVLLQAVESKRNDPRYNNVYGSRYDRFVERQESLFDGLETMARYLAGFPGHKNLIWFTGRLPIDNSSNTDLGGLFPDVESSVDFDASLGQASDLLVLSQISVYPVDTRGLRVDPAFTAASRGIPSLPASANFAIGQAQGHEELREVAEATGGKALFNDDGFKQFVDQVVENGSEYYRVAYTPSNTSMDGGYRKISIQLANRRLRAQYRHGYHAQYESTFVRRGNAAFATTAIEPKQTAWPRAVVTSSRGSFEDSMKLGAIPPTEILFITRVLPAPAVEKPKKHEALAAGNYLRADLRNKPFREYQVQYALRTGSVRFVAAEDGRRQAHIEFVAALYNDDDEVVNSAMSHVDLDLTPAQFASMMRGGVTITQSIAVPKSGSYFFRFGVHDTVANKAGVQEVAVDQVNLKLASAAGRAAH